MDKAELLRVIEKAAEEEVTELNLVRKGIEELPTTIGNLTNLKSLNLSENQLSNLPPEISQLSNLKLLDLRNNQLQTIPVEIGLLNGLKKLDLSWNILREIPKEIGQLVELTDLTLNNSQLRALPPEISGLKNITVLDLSSNSLSALPPEIGQLTRLTWLNLNRNKLTGLPREIGQLAELAFLNLSRNQINEIPSEIGELTNLNELYLRINELSKLPTEIGNLTNLTSLDLISNQLRELPPEIGQLTNLMSLGVRNNNLGALPREINQLIGLTSLNLYGNQLIFLLPNIGKLTSLTSLILRSNKLSTLPTNIGKLINLNTLDLFDNELNELPPEIAQLTNLMRLDIRRNQLSALPPEIGQLSNLTTLSLDSNQLSALPPEIGQLSYLTTLSLNGNRLSALPPEIGQLSNLTSLSLFGNQLSELPPDIGHLSKLIKLFLDSNQLSELPPEIGQLSNLIMLFLDRNQLSALPPEIGQLSNLELLGLRENPLPIPPEIIEKYKEPGTIINYYLEQVTAVELRQLNEAKMLFVGQGGVGKTSLVKRLIDNEFDPLEVKTEGINIDRWSVNTNELNIRLNVWDFGGQEIMHATHQFFLTKRSLYLLVLNAREDEYKNRIEYWLKLIQSFGGASPIIILVNKCDDELIPDIDRRGLMAKYPTIKGFVNTSAKTRQGIKELGKLIISEVGQLAHIHDELPASWFAIKEKLETLEKDYIPYKEYADLCQSLEVTDERSQQTLISFLHDLGIVLNFREDIRLKDTNILNPKWVTNGVYRILNYNPLFQAKGILDRKMLKEILKQPAYPEDKHLFIMDMMRKFELCFDFEGQRDEQFLVPDLLPKEEPYTGKWSHQECLGFQLQYTVLPRSVMSRFIVRFHPVIHKNTYWRNGVVLKRGKNKAQVKADREEKKIYIWIDGKVQTRRAFLEAIRFQFDYIHGTISKLEVAEKVPLPEHPEIVVDYQHLLNLEELGETTFIPEGIKERISVDQLLQGVAKQEDLLRPYRRKARDYSDIEDEESKERSVVFHGTVDTVVLQQQERGEVYMDKKVRKEKVIKVGANATVSAPVVIADNIQQSLYKLAESEVEDDVKSLLEELLQAVNQVNMEVPQDLEKVAEEMARDVETLVKEAASSNPRRKWYEVSIEGLEQAAINIGRVADPVLDIVGKIRKALLGI